MTRHRLIHLPTGQAVALVARADGWWAKGWGVLGRRALAAGEGLWLPGVASVHTIGVGFPLDLLFLDAELRAVRLAPQTPPGRWTVRARARATTVELGAGTLAQTASFSRIGDGWRLERADPAGCS